MSVEELIEELQRWNAPNAEVLVDGIEISKVTSADRGDCLNIIPDVEIPRNDLEHLLEEMEERICDVEYDCDCLRDTLSSIREEMTE